MIVVDSSGWLEFFSDGPYAEIFGNHLRDPSSVLTPTIAIHEVYKWVKRERSEEDALQAVAAMKRTNVTDVSEDLALTAADLSLTHGLAMADSMMLATARIYGAQLVTTDTDFEGIEGTTVLSKKR